LPPQIQTESKTELFIEISLQRDFSTQPVVTTQTSA